MNDAEQAQCPDCGATPGQAHDDGCDVARCTECGRQRISCEHEDGAGGWGAIWTGVWPGVADATRLGWWSLFEPGTGWKRCPATTPGATPDLNRLPLEACWNRETQTWELVAGFASGHCSACQENAERGPSGAWWHFDNAEACPRRGPDGPAVFRIAI